MRNGCTGKVRYSDHEQAVRALQTLNNYSVRQKLPHRIYYCENCKGQHLTSRQSESEWIVRKLVKREQEGAR